MRGMGDYVDSTGDPYLFDKLPSISDAFVPLPKGRTAGAVGVSGDYNPINPTTGLAGVAGPSVTAASAAAAKAAGIPTRMYRVKEGAAPGWPGFFGWLSAVHPQFYDWARVAVPNYAGDRPSYSSSGGQLAGFDPATGIPWYSDAISDGGDPASELMNGLGDDPALTTIAPPDLSSIANMTLPQSATDGITDSTPLPTTTASSQIAQTLSSAAAAFLPLYQQQQVFNAQLARAKAGLPPLDTSNIISANAGLNVGLTPATQKTLLLLAGIAGAFLIGHKLLGRSRR